MIYEVRYSELAGGYCVRQLITGLVVRDSFTRHRETALLRAAELSGCRTMAEWEKAVKEARSEMFSALRDGEDKKEGNKE